MEEFALFEKFWSSLNTVVSFCWHCVQLFPSLFFSSDFFPSSLFLSLPFSLPSPQAPCENMRTPSTYPANMLPHHPAQGNFEDFTCWAGPSGAGGTLIQHHLNSSSHTSKNTPNHTDISTCPIPVGETMATTKQHQQQHHQQQQRLVISLSSHKLIKSLKTHTHSVMMYVTNGTFFLIKQKQKGTKKKNNVFEHLDFGPLPQRGCDFDFVWFVFLVSFTTTVLHHPEAVKGSESWPVAHRTLAPPSGGTTPVLSY